MHDAIRQEPAEAVEDFTEAIRRAESPEEQHKLLAEKQAALELRHPRRKPTEPTPEPVITDPNLRKLYEHSKAKAERRSSYPVAKHAAVRQAPPKPAKQVAPAYETVVSYAHGVSMKETLAKVCARPDISAKGKAVALVLAAHHPHIAPSIPRLMLLTGVKSNTTICRALVELRSKGLLTWKPGSSHQANVYDCSWLTPVVY